jgi:ElaA protein
LATHSDQGGLLRSRPRCYITYEEMNITITPFNNLSPQQLYAILKLRSEVFVVEQGCIFQDMDDKDTFALHLCVWNNDELVAYCRLFNINQSYPGFASIGRIVSSPRHRGSGVGKLLIQHAIQEIYKLFGNVDIRIGAQSYLKSWYGKFGFQQSGNHYDEDGIDHLEMTLYYS